MGFVNCQQEGHIAVLTIDRPQALNALNAQVLADLTAAFAGLDVNETRCVILTGAGEKAFVAGADISAMSRMTQEEAEAFSKYANDIFRIIETFPLPVIAAVNGYALGGGNELALCCDIRICSETAVFGQPEVGLGVIPGFGGTQRLPRLIGAGMAKQMIYSGRNIKAAEALRIGLVNAVYPLDELLPAAKKLAADIAGRAPIAVRAGKTAVDQGLDMDIEQAMALEEKLFGSCFESWDQQEGMAAFLEKRPAESFRNK